MTKIIYFQVTWETSEKVVTNDENHKFKPPQVTWEKENWQYQHPAVATTNRERLAKRRPSADSRLGDEFPDFALICVIALAGLLQTLDQFTYALKRRDGATHSPCGLPLWPISEGRSYKWKLLFPLLSQGSGKNKKRGTVTNDVRTKQSCCLAGREKKLTAGQRKSLN